MPTAAVAPVLERSLRLHPRVALRPEPFGALAYHYGNRRLVFLKHPDVVSVVRSLEHHARADDALTACGVGTDRRASFASALESLIESEVVCEQAG